jgi:ABC-type multidrug transport system permease subunit
VVLVLEALMIGFVNWVLGLAVQHQEMSMAGLSHDAMAVGSWAGGGVFALFLLVCAVLVVRVARHDEMTGRIARIVLIVCAVVHGVVGAVVVGLVGWYAFVLMMVILALLVGTLVLYAPGDHPSAGTGCRPGEAPPSAAPTATA